MSEVIKIEPTEENYKEILKRKQDGENVCGLCVKAAFNILKNKVFTLPQQEEQDE
jgi:bacterioferritin-associated ferredoxin